MKVNKAGINITKRIWDDYLMKASDQRPEWRESCVESAMDVCPYNGWECLSVFSAIGQWESVKKVIPLQLISRVLPAAFVIGRGRFIYLSPMRGCAFRNLTEIQPLWRPTLRFIQINLCVCVDIFQVVNKITWRTKFTSDYVW